MEDSMIDKPNMSFDDKIGNKRVRDGEEEPIGRLEKRPSGIIGLNEFEDYSKERGDEGVKHGGGIIDTFISNVFHKNESVQDGDQVKNDVNDANVEDTKEELGVEVNGGNGEGGEGGGIINAFFLNIFHNNESSNGECDQAKSEVEEKIEDLGSRGEGKDLNGEKLEEKNDTSPDLPSKPLEGNKPNNGKLKPDDYSERVFFLNNN
ncbi:hypothetical protein CTI12_AA489560 [Artemisia annua]|uniref:Uncharacterized protein n=1 Tax=Artemisia annua TaxID=35608 RepID=A0A2U1LHV6_ARTAN|nr:hypothetical protein CTI12_AA489560 [Artemisia annua]